MFRGKESSNRIKISRLVQDLLNFGVSGSLQLWGVGGWGCGVVGLGGWGCGVVGGAPTRAHAHTHAHTCSYTLNMIISIANGSPIGGIPGNSL